MSITRDNRQLMEEQGFSFGGCGAGGCWGEGVVEGAGNNIECITFSVLYVFPIFIGFGLRVEVHKDRNLVNKSSATCPYDAPGTNFDCVKCSVSCSFTRSSKC